MGLKLPSRGGLKGLVLWSFALGSNVRMVDEDPGDDVQGVVAVV